MNKEELLRDLRDRILNCRRCHLRNYCRGPVPGDGPANAKIMFIGEAPGRQEDIEGKPFVGAAGKLLTTLIEEVLNLRRSQVYITNVVKCRPPNNRDPKPEEIEACSPYLNEEIRIIRPKCIITLGRHSTKYILRLGGIKVSSITRVRGSEYRLTILGLNTIIFPTYHPAAALYNPRLREILVMDFQKIKEIIKGEKRTETKTILDFLN